MHPLLELLRQIIKSIFFDGSVTCEPGADGLSMVIRDYQLLNRVVHARFFEPAHIQLVVTVTPPLKGCSDKLRRQYDDYLLCLANMKGLTPVFDIDTETFGIGADFAAPRRDTTEIFENWEREMDRLRSFLYKNERSIATFIINHECEG